MEVSDVKEVHSCRMVGNKSERFCQVLAVAAELLTNTHNKRVRTTVTSSKKHQSRSMRLLIQDEDSLTI